LAGPRRASCRLLGWEVVAAVGNRALMGLCLGPVLWARMAVVVLDCRVRLRGWNGWAGWTAAG
jgi:hypothetical protein